MARKKRPPQQRSQKVSEPTLAGTFARVVWSILVVRVAAFLVATVGALSAVLSFYPKLTVEAKHAERNELPSSSYFEIRNDSIFPIDSVQPLCRYIGFTMFDIETGADVLGFGALQQTATSLMPSESLTFQCGLQLAVGKADLSVGAKFRISYIPIDIERFVRFKNTNCSSKDQEPKWIKLPAPIEPCGK